MITKGGKILLGLVILAAVVTIAVDRLYVVKFQETFSEIEKQRIITSNKLATAKIVQENLNHVRDLVFKNMDFPGQKDTVSHESLFFDFVTTCVNDLKLKLISVKPLRPVTTDRITTYSYDIEIEGDFFRFGELCAKFENSRRIISVESFDVNLVSGDSKDELSTKNKEVKIKMRVNTYRVKKVQNI